jgi:hypothetical protein
MSVVQGTKAEAKRTYDSRYLLVVTHPATNLPLSSFHLIFTQNGAIGLTG